MKMSGRYCWIALVALAFAGCNSPAPESTEPKSNDAEASTSNAGSDSKSIATFSNDAANGQQYRTTVEKIDQRSQPWTYQPESYRVVGGSSRFDENCDGVAEKSQPRFWVGVCSQPAPKALLAQLDLRCGVVVDQVFAGSPAENQLKKHDVIFAIDGEPVRCGKTLGCGINERDGETVRFSIYRNGKPLEVSITPRLMQQLGDEIVQFTLYSDFEKIMCNAAFAEMDLKNPTQEYLLTVVRPGIPLDSDSQAKSKACQGDLELKMSLSFRESEDGELIVVVREGNTTREFTQENIQFAPPAVHRFLKHIMEFKTDPSKSPQNAEK